VKPIKVLYLIDSLASGGAQRQLVTLVNALDRTEFDPVVAVYHTLDHFRPELDRTETRVVQLGRRGARDPAVLLRLAHLLRHESFGLVHCYLRVPGILARLANLPLRSVPVILSERNIDLGHSRFRLLLERALSRRADAVIANAEAVKAHVEKVLPEFGGRVVAVPNGIDYVEPGVDELAAAHRFRATHLGSADLLLCAIGRLETQKAPHLLLDALEQLPEETLHRLRLVWVGNAIDVELAEAVRERAGRQPLSGHVTFEAPTRDVRAVYLAADGLVLPSKWEGFPNVVLEAMSDGLPVIATDVGGTGEMVRNGETGWLVPSGDPAALADAISEFAAMPDEERSDRGRSGASFVHERYSAARLVARTTEVYRSVLEHRAPVPSRGAGNDDRAREGER
jgi:glycosyltransferase involved in cell wall biosynthesis